MKKFYNFVTLEKNNYDLYLYGAIASEKWEESDVTFQDFKNVIDGMNDNSTLNIYQNSPGGEVMVCSAIISLLQRAKDRGITINSYIDGFSASCSSWISCFADNLYIYDHSLLMVHKPMTGFMFGANADEMRKEIELLDKIQNEVMLPIYMKKVNEGITEEEIQELVNNETWLSATEIQKYFKATLLASEKKMVACSDMDMLNKYKNIPKELKEILDKEVNMQEDEMKQEIIEEEVVADESIDNVEEIIKDNIDEQPIEDEEKECNEKTVVENDEEISNLKATIETLTNEKSELENKLNEANEKVIALNEKIGELQPIVDKYNEELTKQQEIENKKILDEKREYYKNKFENLGAKSKFESEEVQSLINNCVTDKDALSKLNLMLVDMIKIDSESRPQARIEQVTKIENLIEVEDDIASIYGFK